MKKRYPILPLALSLFFLSAVTGSNAQSKIGNKSDVSVSRTISPAQMAPDGKPIVVVTVTITKNMYTGPGRIVETFSNDFQAVMISSNRATFQASSGQVQFTWSNIQEDRSISVSYSLEALGQTGNNQTVNGQFFYQNQSFPIATSSFTIDASNLPPYTPPAASANSGSTLDDLFSTITGNPPPTATAAPVAATAPGSNSSPAGSAPATTPAASSAPVQQPMTSAPVQQPVTASAPVQQPVTASAPVQAPVTTPAASSTPAVQEQPATSAPMQQPVTSSSAPVQQVPAETVSAPPVQQQPAMSAPVQQQPAMESSAPVAAASSSNGGGTADGLVYRVQIIVVGDKSKLEQFYRQYKITDQPYYDPPSNIPVRVMVGNYADFNAAKSRCAELKGRGLTDSFIVAYYNGARVTLAEAATHMH